MAASKGNKPKEQKKTQACYKPWKRWGSKSISPLSSLEKKKKGGKKKEQSLDTKQGHPTTHLTSFWERLCTISPFQPSSFWFSRNVSFPKPAEPIWPRAIALASYGPFKGQPAHSRPRSFVLILYSSSALHALRAKSIQGRLSTTMGQMGEKFRASNSPKQSSSPKQKKASPPKRMPNQERPTAHRLIGMQKRLVS